MASTYIGQFTLMKRTILEDSKHNSVTIVREIEMLRLYLDLENMRLENLITYDIIIDEKIDIEIQKIPSMIIQPFVENSIIHGLSAKKSGERKITIEMKQMEDTIFCAIEDTGIGRERSEEINKKKGLIRESFGMKITQNRLEMFSRDNGKKLPFSVIDLKDSEDKAIGTRIEVNF
jgi:LytS/YehU family sensor histidine kinase